MIIMELKKHLPDIVAGLIGMFIAFLVKPEGWNLTNAFIWFAVLAGVYIGLRLVFLLLGIILNKKYEKD